MSLRHAALGLLSQEPGSGYDLLRRFEASLAHVWPATQSQLYTELIKLDAEGLIEVTGVGARNRKEYAITRAGRAELLNWLQHPEEIVVRNFGLLQIFLLSEVPPSQARRHLDEVIGQADRRHEQLLALNAVVRWDDSERDRFARHALEYGITMTAAEVEWARGVRASLDE